MRRRLTGLMVTLALVMIVAGCQPLGLFAPAPDQRTPGQQFGPLALVYINAQKVSAPEVWLASLDGTSHRTVATYELGTLPDDLRGSLLALNGYHEVIVL